ncbi:GMC oxidoreductase domain-containing protein [Trichoderma breve]|uniref:GMC oxidoreductase domain-containing protein n=1 Tax=Trichoderma breve TaxID=2034170 RepID=A0A9W9E967_9HYPO|nr:GMC oxidoreductase domain-containing protein [Trichoderma breve]KAJ4861307.1 GMC oxidoreductase domain-containing protein [Trichoderma breve]
MTRSILKAWLVAAVAASIATAGSNSDQLQVYDYVVVGGGTAGSALATRLSQGLPDKTILLIEAGPEALDEDRINIPGMKGSTLGTLYDWNFTTVPQTGLNGRVLGANRGKVLGGSSALNLMTWDRSAAEEYDGWEQLGNPSWNWKNMIAAMKDVETFTGINSSNYGDQGVGTSGPIHTIINRVIPAQQELWLQSMADLGIPHNLNSLGGNPIGYMNQPSNIDSRTWTRSYAANAYIPKSGSNLHLLLETRVAKVNLRKGRNSYTATGVTLQDGTIISARREVILSCGAIQSPGLLELSGIGSKVVLSKAGIDQIIDLEGVGENLQDHVRYQASYQLKDNFTSFDILKYNTTYAATQLALWHANQTSLYDYTGSGYSYLNWHQVVGNMAAKLNSLAQNVVLSLGSVVDKKKLQYIGSLLSPQVEVIFSDGYTGVKGYPTVGSPLRGNIHITSADVDTKPQIDPQYLSNEYDVQAAIEAIKYCRKIANSSPLSSAWVSEFEPGMAVQTDEDWRQYVLNTTLSIYHPVGTCAMLPKKDGGVVNPELIVYGTNNLRVVDASIIPVLPSAHIQTAVYGIAERAARFVIQKS